MTFGDPPFRLRGSEVPLARVLVVDEPAPPQGDAPDAPTPASGPPEAAPPQAYQERRVTRIARRALDVVVSSVLLVLLAPLLLVIAVAVRLDSPGRALFRQTRLGRDLRPFVVSKYRTMRTDVDHHEHRAYVERLIAGDVECVQRAARPMYKLTEDHRVTRLGRVLRRSSLDELPQLYNVLRVVGAASGHAGVVKMGEDAGAALLTPRLCLVPC